MGIEAISLRKTMILGLVHGAFAWAVYGIVESLFSALLPWVIHPTYVYTTPHWAYTPAHWGFTALLFILYPIIGSLLVGSLLLVFRIASVKFNFLPSAPASNVFSGISKLTIVLAYAINLVAHYDLYNTAFIVLCLVIVCLPLTIVIIVTTLSTGKFERFKMITNLWAICLALVGPMWLPYEVLVGRSAFLKALSILCYFALIALVLFIVKRVKRAKKTERPETEIPANFVKSFIILFILIMAILGLNVFLKQKPIVHVQNAGSPAVSQNSPNVILIVMDTVCAGHVSVNGYERNTTPRLKILAKNATLYTRAIAPSNMTLSTHASIFTGLYARKHGAHFAFPYYPTGRPLQEKFHSLAEILSENGYFTSDVIGNTIYLTLYHGLDQGFQYQDMRNRVPFFGQAQSYYLKQAIRDVFTEFSPLSTFELKWRNAEEINDGAYEVLRRVKKDHRPFFLFVNYMDAHWPYLPPHPFDTMFPGKQARFTTPMFQRTKDEVMNLKRDITDIERNHLMSQYDGAIAYMDLQIWNLVAYLRKLGLYDNTLLIITSDHGEVFGERNIVEHSFAVYQDEIHVPLIVKYPNSNDGRIVDNVVSLIDIVPTILDILGKQMPKDIQGKSLLAAQNERDRNIISESFVGEHMIKGYGQRFQAERALFVGNSKFIRSDDGRRELYGLSKDPNETQNLFSPEASESRKLEHMLSKWLSDIPEESGLSHDLDKAAIERLRSLGYTR